MTLIEKLDALSRRYAREVIEPDGFVRHYEDAAHIIRSLDRLPAIKETAHDLADDMLREKGIVAIPSADEPALLLADAARRTAIDQALAKLSPMFSGTAHPGRRGCTMIREWIRGNLG